MLPLIVDGVDKGPWPSGRGPDTATPPSFKLA